MADEQKELLDSENQQEVVGETSEQETDQSAEIESDYLDDEYSGFETAEELAEKNRRLYARLKKEAEKRKKLQMELETLKKSTSKEPEANKSNKQTQSGFDEASLLERAALLAKGYSLEDLKVLEDIRQIEANKGKSLSITEATEHYLFQAYMDKKEKEEKAKKAQLGAAKSSSGRRVEQENKPMSREEHQEFFKKAVEEFYKNPDAFIEKLKKRES